MNSFHATLRFTAHALLSPVHAVVGFFAPWEKEQNIVSLTPAGAGNLGVMSVQMSTVKSNFPRAANQAQYAFDRSIVPALARKKVRVLRVEDAAIPSTSAGRMVISGRLSEVCAELERLTQNSISQHASEVAFTR